MCQGGGTCHPEDAFWAALRSLAGIAGFLLCLATAVLAQSGTYSQISWYPISNPSAFPEGITAGPDGALWFTESGCYGGPCYIGRITTAGGITDYPVPTPNSQPWSITAGPDGALWFTEYDASQIGQITTAGAVTMYQIPFSYGPENKAGGIVEGPGGNLWLADGAGNIWRMIPPGVFTQYPVRARGAGTRPITNGPDGAMWFTVYCNPCSHDVIGRITTAGIITKFPAPSDGTLGGPDGGLWSTTRVMPSK